MVSPAPVDPPGQPQTAHSPDLADDGGLPPIALLRNVGFQWLLVILGIALAFM